MPISSARTMDVANIRYNPEFTTTPDLNLFDPTNQALNAKPVAQGGRNAAWFVNYKGQQAVLRHYKRGGFIAKLISRSYFWTGAQQTRSWAEFDVLLHLRNRRVDVPIPLAALWQRRYLSYRAAIIVSRIPSAFPIAHLLEKTSAQTVALAVKRMHDAGVWHADLNVFNVLVDANQLVHLIDFDKAKVFDVVDSKHRQNNLLRLRRSLIKVRGEIGRQWYLQFHHAYQQLIKA